MKNPKNTHTEIINPDPKTSEKKIGCIKCDDTGSVMVNNYTIKCSCRIRRIKHSVLGNRFENCSFINFQPQGNIKCQKKAYDIVIKNLNGSYLFIGDYGAGKTHFLSCQYADLLDRNYSNLIYITEKQIAKELRNIFRDDTFSPTIDSLKVKGLDSLHLFLDDIGTIKPTEFMCQEIDEIIDIIYRNNFRLSISSSLTIPEIAEYFGENGGSIARRIEEICQVIQLS